MRHFLLLVAILIVIWMIQPVPTHAQLPPFTNGHIDSPYVVPDGSALYFLQSPATPSRWFNGDIGLWIENGAPSTPDTQPLPGHMSAGTPMWWATDIYVSYLNEDGTWSCPANVGEPINTIQSECCMWVSDDQTSMIFSRPSFEIALHGSFIAYRASVQDEWGTPERLYGALGDLLNTTFTNFHQTPSGNLYFDTETTSDRLLYFAEHLGSGVYSEAELMPPAFQSPDEDTQIWVNDTETELYYNYRDETGETLLMHATRPDITAQWSDPTSVELISFEDDNGLVIWGEPSFTADGTMYYVRVNTANNLATELFRAPKNEDGSFGPPEPLEFANCD